jgi:hypothetical protein
MPMLAEASPPTACATLGDHKKTKSLMFSGVKTNGAPSSTSLPLTTCRSPSLSALTLASPGAKSLDGLGGTRVSPRSGKPAFRSGRSEGLLPRFGVDQELWLADHQVAVGIGEFTQQLKTDDLSSTSGR